MPPPSNSRSWLGVVFMVACAHACQCEVREDDEAGAQGDGLHEADRRRGYRRNAGDLSRGVAAEIHPAMEEGRCFALVIGVIMAQALRTLDQALALRSDAQRIRRAAK